MDEVKDYCRERFERIEGRLDEKSKLLDENNTEIEVLKTDMGHLTKSLNALTRALWGVAGATVATLASFVVWYLQSLS